MAHSQNHLFVEKLKTESGIKQAADRLQGFLRTRTYEDSVFARIMPPKPISSSDLDRIPAEDGGGTALFRKVIDKEFSDVWAAPVDFQSNGPSRYMKTGTFNVDFHRIASPIFEIDEDELRAKEQPLTTIVKQAITAHIDRAIDIAGRRAFVAALAATGGRKDITSPDDYVMPRNLTDLFNAIEDDVGPNGERTLNVATIVMTRAQWNNIAKWTQSDIGTLTGTEFWRDGYTYGTLLGRRVIVTNKSDIFPTNEILAFAAPDFLGIHYDLSNDRFEIQKDFSLLRMKGWKTHGAAIGNVEAVARLTLGVDE